MGQIRKDYETKWPKRNTQEGKKSGLNTRADRFPRIAYEDKDRHWHECGGVFVELVEVFEKYQHKANEVSKCTCTRNGLRCIDVGLRMHEPLYTGKARWEAMKWRTLILFNLNIWPKFAMFISFLRYQS